MLRKKLPLLLLLFVTSCHFSGIAQTTTPTILDLPNNWRFERVELPFSFAPNIGYEGFGELRFAPGMFDTLSPTYFTYIFAISINDQSKFKQKEIKRFLLEYYRGLCDAVANSEKQTIDISKIEIKLKKIKMDKPENTYYDVSILFFDPFNNGKKLSLKMELKISLDKKTNKLYLLALVSSKPKTSKIWQKLHQTAESITFN